MKNITIVAAVLISVMMMSCNKNQPGTAQADTKVPVFARGEKVTNNYFTGDVWVQMLVYGDTIHNISAGNVTFNPGARTNWHIHPGGQILIVTEGKGFYHEKGKPAQTIRKSDIVRIPPATEHWHGAAPDSSMAHIAISTNLQQGSVVWLLPVSDEEYDSAVVK
ncbi:MAG: cupin domain-containing protein [Bacteroidales bacterium]|jgi:quercetin dioxygenase-like cupin family protein|nr:cupin domain-containing protein [Bacteroidales bacterium]